MPYVPWGSSLLHNVLNIQQCRQEVTIEETDELDPQPLTDEIWEAPISEGFKPFSLAKFAGCSNPYEHIASINIQMVTIESYDSLKCKLLFGDAALRWYMGLPQPSISIHQDLVKKIMHQFAAS